MRNAPIRNLIIYGLLDPRDDKVRYRGKSVTGLKRAYAHKSRSRQVTDHKSAWVRSLTNLGLMYKICVFEENVNTEDELNVLEIKYISAGRKLGWNLTNMSAGGEGTTGVFPSKETRKKQSIAHIGHKRSEETKAKWRVHMIGHPVSQETRAKIGKAHKGRTLSPETRRKISISVSAAMTPEHRAKLSAAHMGHKASPETRLKNSLASQGEKHWAARLTEKDILDIRSSTESGAALGRRYGVSRTTICDIRKRISWRHIK